MRQEFLRRIRRPSGIATPVTHILHALHEVLGSDVDGTAKVERIEILDVARDNHHIISRLVIYYKTSVTVIDYATRRIDGLAQKSVGVGRVLVFVLHHLEVEEAYHIYYSNYNYESAYDILPFGQVIVFSHFLESLSSRCRASETLTAVY